MLAARGLTYDPVSFYALSNNQTMIIQINDSRVYDLPFEISPSHNVRVFESLSIGTQPLTNGNIIHVIYSHMLYCMI